MKTIFCITLFLVCIKANGQNLVANPSFEDANICEYNERCNPSAWFDIANQPHGYALDNRPGATGSKWIHIITGNRINKQRQYWRTMLLHTLEKGKRYTISISVHGWDSEPNVHDIGLYFTDTMLLYPSKGSDTLIQPKNYVDFMDAKYTELKNGWFRLQKEYVATGNYQHLLLGNFSSDDYTAIAKTRTSKSAYLVILVDDIEIMPVEKIACEDCKKNKDSLYAITRRPYPVIIQPAIVPTKKVADKIDTLVIHNILFAPGSYTITNPDTLDLLLSELTQSGIKKIKVIGYTDDTGSITANESLSQKRASEIAKLLHAKFGIAPSIIEATGMGISTSFTTREQNRRVEIYIYH